MHVGVTDARESQDARASRCSDASIQNETRASNVPFRFAIKISLRFPLISVRPSHRWRLEKYHRWRMDENGWIGSKRPLRLRPYIYIYIYSRDREVIRADANGGRRIPSRSSLVRIRLGRGLLCPLITIHLRLWSISRVRRPVSASCSCTVYPRLRHILRSHALRTVILVNTTLFVALSTADYSFPLPAPPLPPSFLPCSLPSSARHF